LTLIDSERQRLCFGALNGSYEAPQFNAPAAGIGGVLSGRVRPKKVLRSPSEETDSGAISLATLSSIWGHALSVQNISIC